MRLIDADDLFPYGAVPYFENDGFATADKLYGIINNAPTVDAVEVVRCKDCKHFCVDLSGRDAHYCLSEKGGFIVRRKLDDFCSYGERKGNG